MEINELKYFLAVSEVENIHKAAKNINVSPSALSKAISKLELELNSKLFNRVGRNIILSPEGKYLKEKAYNIINLETQTRIDILGKNTSFTARIGAPENLLSIFGPKISKKIIQFHPNASIEFLIVAEKDLVTKLEDGEIHLAITTYKNNKKFLQKKIDQTNFQTVIGKKHKLYKKALKETININEILTYPFISTQKNILGSTKSNQSLDGWRDDKFERKIKYIAPSLSLMINTVLNGDAIAYLPEYLTKYYNLTVVKIADCPYVCTQVIHLLSNNKEDAGWINNLFQG